MITFAIALADKWQKGDLNGTVYIAAIIADAYWLSSLAGLLK